MRQKSIKKLSCILIIFCLTFMLTACNASKENSDEPKAENDTLYNRGLEMVNLLHEMVASEEYRTLYSTAELDNIVTELTNGNYENCIAVYQVDISDTQLQDYLKLAGLEMDGLSDNLLSQITKRAYGGIITQLIAKQSGVNAIAVTSIVSSSSMFVYEELKEPTMYIYEYNGSYPVVVSFYPGDDGAVSAGACFFLIDELKTVNEAEFSDTLKKQFTSVGIAPDISKIK